jgi:hypothetical protein
VILRRLCLALALSIVFVSGVALGAPRHAHRPDSALCIYAKRHELKLASCMSKAAFARDYRTWSWSDDLQEAMQNGNFDWDTAVKNLHYDPQKSPDLLGKLGASPSSTPAQRQKGWEFAMLQLSCMRAAELAEPLSEGDRIAETARFTEPAGTYIAQTLFVPAVGVWTTLRRVEQRFARAAALANAGHKSAAAKLFAKGYAQTCSEGLTREAGLIDLIVADENDLRPQPSTAR